MKTLALLALSTFLVLPLAAADTSTRRARRGPAISPEIHEDGRVAFRVQASQAEEVTLSGQWGVRNVPLRKEDGGIWSITVDPIAPGVYEYSFAVDGFRMIDPGNPAIKPMRQPRTSILHIPGNPPNIHDFRDVPHGTVRLHTYDSRSLDRLRSLVVYTPPGYEHHPDRTFPTLYLQHGMGDNQETWTVHGKAHWILDNLIAEGKAKPMVVVMMDGHASASGAGVAGFGSNTEAFERDLLDDAMPFIEQHYRVRKDAAHRCLVGLSMGGGQSLTIGLNHADLFGWVGGFSSATPSAEAIDTALDDPTATNDKLELLWIACGKDDFLLQRNQQFIGLLQEKGLDHDWILTEGDHSWPVWRIYLAEFAPLLFRE